MSVPQERRVLVTGSRSWTEVAIIRAALAAQWGTGEAVLVSGACPRGADRIAETIWTRWGGHVERHRADWTRHGRSAGFRRNAAMVAAGATVCLAFIRDGSAGASHTARLAEAAGIPTHRHTPQSTPRPASVTRPGGPNRQERARRVGAPPIAHSNEGDPMLRDPVDSTPEPDTPGVVLTCGDPACRHTFEPDPDAFAASRLACPRCGGWTFQAGLCEPAPAGGERR